MGMLVQGKWVDQDPVMAASDGRFVRPGSAFRNTIANDIGALYPPSSGRYHLFTAPTCPWAHRVVIARRLKRLEGIVGLSEARLPKTQGWSFAEGIDDLRPQGDMFHLHQIYTHVDPQFTGRVTVPVLWDRETKTIVNNESSEILRILNSAFEGLAEPSIDLCPENLRAEIDRINLFVYENINNGVYRCGFAKTQEAYETSCRSLFAGLDEMELLLSRQRYLLGSQLTEADIRLFTTLARFEMVYALHFKCNLRPLSDYHNLSNYLRDLNQTDGFAGTVNVEAIKAGYYFEHAHINPSRLIPLGPPLQFDHAHDRHRFQ